MKVLIAHEGKRKGDYAYTEVGEMVYIIDHKHFGGFVSRKATTCAEVMDAVMSSETYIKNYTDSVCRALGYKTMPEDLLKEVTAEAQDLLRVADAFEVGDICRLTKRAVVAERRVAK